MTFRRRLSCIGTLVGLGRTDDAYELYSERLHDPLYYRFGAYETARILLQSIPQIDGLPKVNRDSDRSWILQYIAMCFERTGRPRKAAAVCDTAIAFNRKKQKHGNLAWVLNTNSMVLQDLGRLQFASQCGEEAVRLVEHGGDDNQKAIIHRCFGRTLLTCGRVDLAMQHFEVAASIYGQHRRFAQGRSLLMSLRANWHLLQGEARRAFALAQLGMDEAESADLAHECIAATVVACNALIERMKDKFDSTATQQFEGLLTRAQEGCRRFSLLQLLPRVQLANAEFHLLRGDRDSAIELAKSGLQTAVRSDYRLHQADIHIFLADAYVQQDQYQLARESAEHGLKLSLCDGGQYTYSWGVRKAKAIPVW